jgi:hypothetical protein
MYACINSLGVYLSLRSAHIANNSNINIRNIGQSSDNPNGALQCITDNFRCCSNVNPRLGEWYQPNGALVQGTTSTTAFYRTRGDNGEVSLNRPSGVESLTGRFCCEVPDITSINQTLCVNIGKYRSVHHSLWLSRCWWELHTGVFWISRWLWGDLSVAKGTTWWQDTSCYQWLYNYQLYFHC